MSICEANQIAVTTSGKIAIAQYYNQYINEDEEMPESAPQFNLIRYLVDLLRWHFRDKIGISLATCPSTNRFIIGRTGRSRIQRYSRADHSFRRVS